MNPPAGFHPLAGSDQTVMIGHLRRAFVRTPNGRILSIPCDQPVPVAYKFLGGAHVPVYIDPSDLGDAWDKAMQLAFDRAFKHMDAAREEASKKGK